MGTIRFLLALAVVIAHTGSIPFYNGIGSMLAVQGFYVISGFLIARIWDIKYADQSNGTRLFYLSRAARIYLMYWAVLLLALLFAVVFYVLRGYWPQYMTVDPSLPWSLILYQVASNFSLIGSSVAHFLGATSDGSFFFTTDFSKSPVLVWNLLTLPPAWTLELELWFYLLAPFILRLRSRWIVGLAAASFALRFTWYRMGYDADPWTYRFFPFEIGVFLLGVIAYRIKPYLPAKRWLSMACYIVAVAAASNFNMVSHRFLFLLVFAAMLPLIFDLTKDWRLDRFLADISFPLYLSHWPIAMIAWRWPEFWLGMPAIVMSIIYSCALVVYVERPMDRWRHARFGAGPPGRASGQSEAYPPFGKTAA